MGTIEERVTKLEYELTPIQFQLAALDDKVDKLDGKVDSILEETRGLGLWRKAVGEQFATIGKRFDDLAHLIRDSHSENGARG